MSDFSVRVLRITDHVVRHPDADRLDLVPILGYTAIANRTEDGQARYHQHDLVVYIPEGAVVPKWLLQSMGMWLPATEGSPATEDKKAVPPLPERGSLSTSAGNIVKARRLRGIFSQGLLYDVKVGPDGPYIITENDPHVEVREGDDVGALLGITKYEPAIPAHLNGDVCNLTGHTMRYDFESIQSRPGMFTTGEPVIATEKLHGTHCAIGMIPDLTNPELFGSCKNIFVASKGLGAKGLVMKNMGRPRPPYVKKGLVFKLWDRLRAILGISIEPPLLPYREVNVGNVYVDILRKYLATGFEDRLNEVSKAHQGATIHIFGEIFGRGIQDLHYGQAAPVLKIFDIAINKRFLPFTEMMETALALGLDTVPVLYVGPFSMADLIVHRDGKDAVAGTNIREGIVIKSESGSPDVRYGRKIAKWVSPKYLLRNNKDATEFN